MALLSTTGTQPTVTINDLSTLVLVHPVVNMQLEDTFTASEIAESVDLQAAIDAGTIILSLEVFDVTELPNDDRQVDFAEPLKSNDRLKVEIQSGISIVGPPGPTGNDGAQGIQGIQGIPGNDGNDGNDGVDGVDGAPGTTDYLALTNLPTLGTAAATAIGDYATAAQGALADTAIQPAGLTPLTTRLDIRETVYEVYEAGTTTSSGTPVIIDMDTQRFATPGFSLAAGRVTITTAGRYKITYTASFDGTNNTRATILADLYQNAAIVPGSRGFTYSRNTASGECSISKTIIIDVPAGAVMDIRASVISGTSGDHPSIADSSNITFERIL